jgi:nucleoside triphosphatase
MGFMKEKQYPEVTVGALIINPKGKILLIKSHKWKNKYTIPGGHIELGETMIEALKREVKEETGLNIFNIKFLCFQEFIFDSIFWRKKHFIFFDFVCETKGSEVKLNTEGEEFLWISAEEALELPVEPYAKHSIKEYLKRIN